MPDESIPSPDQVSGQRPPPRCKALLLCEKVIIDAQNGFPSVISVFDHFMLPKYPSRVKQFYAFLQFVDGIGRYDVVIEVHDLKKGEVIGRGTGIGLEFEHRPNRMNVVVPIPPLNLPHPGAYDLVVIANGQEIDRQQFIAVAPQEPSDESGA